VEHYSEAIRSWFDEIVEILKRNLRDLEADGKLNAFAKWRWFARQFGAALEKLSPDLWHAFGIPLEELPVFQ
jgi:hypothetical protein